MSRKRTGQKQHVAQYSMNNDLIKIFESCTNAALAVGTSQSNISAAARGDRKTTAGFKWVYVAEADDENEVWITHSTGYKVSSLGRVALSEHLKTYGQSTREGYCRIRLTVSGERKSFSVHRLVAEAFYPKQKQQVDDICLGKAQVNHIDKNTSNNNIANLEWVTPSQNAYHRWRK